MPIKIPNDLPAIAILKGENAFVMNKHKAEQQDIRELKILILNLMPTKIETETQLLRLLSNSPLQVEVEFLKLSSYAPKNTPEEHLYKFYKTMDEIKGRKFDGMIITGAPIEHLEFEEVEYWKELTEIMEWSVDHVTSILYLCWGAQAGLYYHFGIQKYPLKNGQKLSGIYEHKVNNTYSELVRGFDDIFYAPHSRYTECRKEDVERIDDLEILSVSKEAGMYLVATRDLRQVFVTGHSEYDPLTIKNEYDRDLAKNVAVNIPVNYFEHDKPSNYPLVRWRGHANLLFTNWLNYGVYQVSDYHLKDDTNAVLLQRTNILNVALCGLGNVGKAFIEHVLKNRLKIQKEDTIRINIFAIANSKKMFFNEKGIQRDWEVKIKNSPIASNIDRLIDFSEKKKLENRIFVDATSSEKIASLYHKIIKKSFDIVAASKIANSSSYIYYIGLREILKRENRYFFYETNVGAGLPLIDTIKYLHKSGDSITKIRGVFSGSLSYICNQFSSFDSPISVILKRAVEKGLTEPDPRDDLNGKDVARKLLILSREIGIKIEIEDIVVESLIPDELQKISLDEFWNNISVFDNHFNSIKSNQKEGYVLRYIGEFDGQNHSVQLKSIPRSNPIGQLQGADSLFEIYTERYNSNPLIIQGAGAGSEVTAIGVLSDILKLGHRITHKMR